MSSSSYNPLKYEEKNPVSSSSDNGALPWVAWQREKEQRLSESQDRSDRIRGQEPLPDSNLLGKLSFHFTKLSTTVSAAATSMSIASSDQFMDLLSKKAMSSYNVEFPEYVNAEKLYSEFDSKIVSDGIVYHAKVFISEHHVCISFDKANIKVRVRVPLDLVLASVKATALPQINDTTAPHVVDSESLPNALCNAVKIYTTDGNCHILFNFNTQALSKINNFASTHPPAIVFHNVLLYAIEKIRN